MEGFNKKFDVFQYEQKIIEWDSNSKILLEKGQEYKDTLAYLQVFYLKKKVSDPWSIYCIANQRLVIISTSKKPQKPMF